MLNGRIPAFKSNFPYQKLSNWANFQSTLFNFPWTDTKRCTCRVQILPKALDSRNLEKWNDWISTFPLIFKIKFDSKFPRKNSIKTWDITESFRPQNDINFPSITPNQNFINIQSKFQLKTNCTNHKYEESSEMAVS